MTLKEAREAALNCRPIMYNGIRYERIALVGIYYSDRSKYEENTVKLLDKQGREVWSRPERCEVAAE
jgi:hypothetical protein